MKRITRGGHPVAKRLMEGWLLDATEAGRLSALVDIIDTYAKGEQMTVTSIVLKIAREAKSEFDRIRKESGIT